jgi:hypothetical protein
MSKTQHSLALACNKVLHPIVKDPFDAALPRRRFASARTRLFHHPRLMFDHLGEKRSRPVGGAAIGGFSPPLLPTPFGLERLRIFISPTCVSFSTGTRFVAARFFLSVRPMTSGSYVPSPLRDGHD